MGRITGILDGRQNLTGHDTDSWGRVCEMIDQERYSETFRYDQEGRMALHVNRNGNQVKTIYNVNGNPVIETGTDAKNVTGVEDDGCAEII